MMSTAGRLPGGLLVPLLMAGEPGTAGTPLALSCGSSEVLSAPSEIGTLLLTKVLLNAVTKGKSPVAESARSMPVLLQIRLLPSRNVEMAVSSPRNRRKPSPRYSRRRCC